MAIGKFLLMSFVAAFITMIYIYFIKKLATGRQIPIVSAVAEGV